LDDTPTEPQRGRDYTNEGMMVNCIDTLWV